MPVSTAGVWGVLSDVAAAEVANDVIGSGAGSGARSDVVQLLCAKANGSGAGMVGSSAWIPALLTGLGIVKVMIVSASKAISSVEVAI